MINQKTICQWSVQYPVLLPNGLGQLPKSPNSSLPAVMEDGHHGARRRCRGREDLVDDMRAGVDGRGWGGKGLASGAGEQSYAVVG